MSEETPLSKEPKETKEQKEEINFDFSGFSTKRVTLQTSDEVNFEIPKELTTMMITVNNMLEGMVRFYIYSHSFIVFHSLLFIDTDESEHSEPIFLSNIRSKILREVIRFCLHHYTDSINASNFNSADLSDWDREFFDIKTRKLFEIMMAFLLL